MTPEVLRDLEKIEEFHLRREGELRDIAYENASGTPARAKALRDAEMHLAQAQTVRCCIVTIQAAENRVNHENK